MDDSSISFWDVLHVKYTLKWALKRWKSTIIIHFISIFATFQKNISFIEKSEMDKNCIFYVSKTYTADPLRIQYVSIKISDNNIQKISNKYPIFIRKNIRKISIKYPLCIWLPGVKTTKSVIWSTLYDDTDDKNDTGDDVGDDSDNDNDKRLK